MNNTLVVSVIIPFYRNREWLEEALYSVENQTYKNLEVIVVNDGSEEDISDLQFKFSRFKFYEITNSGAAQARNLGMDISTGEYICFLDSDDIWASEKIELQLNYMVTNALYWSHTSYVKFWDKNPDKTEMVNAKFGGNIIPKMFITCPIATPCVMILSTVIKNDNSIRFNKDFRVGEDSYLWFKIAENHDLGYLDQYLTMVRIRGQNAALDPLLQLEAKAQTYTLLKSRKDLFRSSIQYNFALFGFRLCFVFYHFINSRMGKSSILNKKEIIYILYFFPYLYLKIMLKISNL